MNIKTKLLMGFFTILGAMILVSANTYFQLIQSTKIKERLLNLRHPTILAGMALEDGINLSLAGLRGYMILGDDEKKAELFKNERSLGWQKIDKALEQFNRFSLNWTEKQNIVRLNEIKKLVEKFRRAQLQVENLSHTTENIPSQNLLINKAVPIASEVIVAITSLIDEEGQLKATAKRKKLLKLLADSRGTFALALANLRAYLLSGDEAFKIKFYAHWQTNQQRFEQLADMYKLFNSKQKTAWQNYQQQRDVFSTLPERMFQLRDADNWNLANYFLATEAAPKSKSIKNILLNMRNSQEQLARDDKLLLDSKTAKVELILIVATVLAVIVGSFIAFFLSKSITSRLSLVMERASNIARGRLDTQPLPVTGNDEIAVLTQAINDMAKNLRHVIQGVSQATKGLLLHSTQLQNVSKKTEQGVLEQTQETAQVATGMNELSATVSEVARNASDASDAANEADGRVNSGKLTVSESVSSIDQLEASMNSAVEQMEALGEATNNVDSIVEVINNIAGQTNLLALNAAIEAARAGEQGRGFAVVADEVRTLANRTQQSTEEISNTLDKLKESVLHVAQVMKTGQQQANACANLATHVNDSLEHIANSVSIINDMNAQIATAAEEQSVVCEEMNQHIVDINNSFEDTLENTQETRNASKSVDETAGNLEKLMTNFAV